MYKFINILGRTEAHIIGQYGRKPLKRWNEWQVAIKSTNKLGEDGGVLYRLFKIHTKFTLKILALFEIPSVSRCLFKTNSWIGACAYY